MKIKTIICLTLVMSLSIPTAFAKNGDSSKTNSDKITVNKLLDQGLSKKDAEYYVQLEEFVEELEKEGKEIFFHDAEDLSDEYVRENPNEFRSRILQGDPSAIKKGFLSKAKISGESDLKALVKEEKGKGKIRNKYTIKYSDGSQVSVLMDTVKSVDTSNNKVSTNGNTYIDGPWNDDTYITSSGVTRAGDYTSTTEWEYYYGTHYAHVKDVVNWSYDGNSKATYINDTGAASSAGIVKIIDRDRSNNVYTTGTTSRPFQTYTDVVFEVSASFSASYKKLSLDVGAGASWHQYAITEIWGSGDVDHFAGHFF